MYLWRALCNVLSQTCAPDPSQKYLWSTLGAQVFDTRRGDRPQKYLWWVLAKVLSRTCALNPCQKSLWGILLAQVPALCPHLRASPPSEPLLGHPGCAGV